MELICIRCHTRIENNDALIDCPKCKHRDWLRCDKSFLVTLKLTIPVSYKHASVEEEAIKYICKKYNVDESVIELVEEYDWTQGI